MAAVIVSGISSFFGGRSSVDSVTEEEVRRIVAEQFTDISMEKGLYVIEGRPKLALLSERLDRFDNRLSDIDRKVTGVDARLSGIEASLKELLKRTP